MRCVDNLIFSSYLIPYLPSILQTLFLMLINVWGILLQDVKKTRNAACILLVLNLATIVWAVVDMHHKEEFEDFLVSHAYLAMLCANASSKFSLCVLIIAYGYQLRDTLIISPTLLVKMTEEEISIKRLLLRRIKIVLMVSGDIEEFIIN